MDWVHTKLQTMYLSVFIRLCEDIFLRKHANMPALFIELCAIFFVEVKKRKKFVIVFMIFSARNIIILIIRGHDFL